MPSRAAPLRILLVEDNPGDARLIRETLRDADSLAMELTHVERLVAARAHCRQGRVDVVLLDLSLPDASGLDTVREALSFAKAAPIIVLTGLDDEDVAVQAVHAGAQDYLVKGRVDATLLARSIRYARERHRLERERSLLLERERHARAEAEAAVRVREDVLRVVSHDLGNLLSGMKIHARVLEKLLAHPSPSQPPPAGSHSPATGRAEAIERVGDIRELTIQMDRLRQDLLDMASLEAGRLSVEPGRHEVRAVLNAALRVVAGPAAEKSLSLALEIDRAVSHVHADPDRIQQVLANLLGNAVKFSPQGGHITLRAAPQQGAVRISVGDGGVGIAAEHLPHVFDRFWKLCKDNPSGVGLGLAIARGIVQAHGGQIGIESEPGGGTTVSFTLPAAADP